MPQKHKYPAFQHIFYQRSLHRATDATFVPKYASDDIIRSGHLQYDTLYASNEKEVIIQNIFLKFTANYRLER